jgi:hypothetical protein
MTEKKTKKTKTPKTTSAKSKATVNETPKETPQEAVNDTVQPSALSLGELQGLAEKYAVLSAEEKLIQEKKEALRLLFIEQFPEGGVIRNNSDHTILKISLNVRETRTYNIDILKKSLDPAIFDKIVEVNKKQAMAIMGSEWVEGNSIVTKKASEYRFTT